MNRKLRNLLQADLFSEPAAEPSPAPEQPPARKPRYTPKRQFVAPNTDKLPTGETRQELEQRRQRIHVKAYIRELGELPRACRMPELFRKQFSRTPAAALAKLAHVQPLYLRDLPPHHPGSLRLGAGRSAGAAASRYLAQQTQSRTCSSGRNTFDHKTAAAATSRNVANLMHSSSCKTKRLTESSLPPSSNLLPLPI